MKNTLFEKFDDIPCFSKQSLRLVYSGSENSLNERIKRAIKNNVIIQLKKGLYLTTIYLLKEPNKTALTEFVSSKLRFPSYVSLSYVLNKYNLLTEATYTITSITSKTTRLYTNSLGTFSYSNINSKLFTGFEKLSYGKNSYFIASPAKAMFDYLYLKNNLSNDLQQELLEDLRINWDNFSKKDFKEFTKYVKLANNKKMTKICQILQKEFYAN